MIRPVRFAILALLILGVFAVGAALDWSASIRTAVPAIELRPAPLPELTQEPARPIARTKPAKPASAERKSRSATPDLRPVSRPTPVAVSRPAAPAKPKVGTSARESTRPVASSQPPRETPKQQPSGNGPTGTGGDTTPAAPPTTTPTTQTETSGAAPAPAPPTPAGEGDEDEEGDDDDDGDDGGDDD
jgi:hypothetical protein